MNIVVATDGSDPAIAAARRSMVIPEYEDPMEDAGWIEGPGRART